MASPEQTALSHYGGDALEQAILAGLEALGREPGAVTEADLAAVGEFHMGGRALTGDIVARLGLEAGTRVLDIGCGIGGTARFLAERHGCRVTGIDITPGYIAVARRLTALVGLADRVAFEVGSATALPVPDGAFDVVMLLHVGMNVPDKPAIWAEARRALAAGGRLVVYDVMRIGAGEVSYPTAWASTAEASFLAAPDDYRRSLAQAGFAIMAERDHRDRAIAAFRQAKARAGAGGPPPLGLHLLMGKDTGAKAANMLAALEAGCIAPVEIVARRI